jgi:DNA-binding transcriptional regulator YiaG
MTLKELREQSGMTRPEFAEHFGIPYRTVQSWELGDRKCPQYVLDLMEYKLRKENFIK